MHACLCPYEYAQVSMWIHVPMYVDPKRRYGFSHTAVTSIFGIQFSALKKKKPGVMAPALPALGQ